ncbi:MAG TPA: DNA-3-methyladenine glycosylase [Steroidobacteraceae bacterium]|nr:DNA-3-methyladenine glycosylase [Steroidobacteraceae bacterium]
MTLEIIAHLGESDAVMKRLIAAAGPYAPASLEDRSPYEALARAIAHQQLNGKAAESILNRFISTCGQGGFPAPEDLLGLEDAALRSCGFSFSKIAALRDLAAKTVSGVVPERDALHPLNDLEIIERLTAVRGIGRWTVEMLLMFQLRRPDVLPVADFGVRHGFRLAYGLKKMPDPKVLALFGERWAPHRSAAAWYLWRAVDLHREGRLPRPAQAPVLPRPPRRRRKAARKLKRAAVSAARPARSGARTRARRRPAPRSRAPAKKK